MRLAMLRTRTLAMAVAAVVAPADLARGEERPPTEAEPTVQVQAKPNGLVSVMPMEFVQRAAGRSMRRQFRERYRQVAPDRRGAAARGRPAGVAEPEHAVTVLRPAVPGQVLDTWRRYDVSVPGLRGFRAPISDAVSDWPQRPEPAAEAAATFVAEHLAGEGLVRTVMQLMLEHDLPWVRRQTLNLEIMRNVGIPTDLLAYFRVGDRTLEQALVDWYSRAAPEGSIELTVRAAELHFRPSCRGFVVATEDGTEPIDAFRVQLAGTGFEHGAGDGSALDVFMQLLDAQPGAWGMLTAHQDDVEAIATSLAGSAGPVTIVASAMPLSRWAHDGAKVGSARRLDEPARKRTVTLVPRFASRDETTPHFLPGDSFLFKTLSGDPGPGGLICQSPLSFQGSNLLAVSEAGARRPILLVGEGEVYRNTALGLSREQVLEMFRLEFGAARIEVLPAVALHVGMEVTVRRHGDRRIACMVDEVAGARLVLSAGAELLAHGGVLTRTERRQVAGLLDGGDIVGAVRVLTAILPDYRDERQRVRPELAGLFGAPSGSAAAATERFLLAMDLLLARELAEPELAALPAPVREYFTTYRTRALDRVRLADRLRRMGMEVVMVPGLADAEVSLNPLNGIQTPMTYLMPVWGAPYEALDEAAGVALSRAFGDDVEIIGIRSAALQAWSGGVRRAASVYFASR